MGAVSDCRLCRFAVVPPLYGFCSLTMWGPFHRGQMSSPPVVHAWLQLVRVVFAGTWSSRAFNAFDVSISIWDNHQLTVTRRKGSAYLKDRRIQCLEWVWFLRVLRANWVTPQRPSFTGDRLMRNLTQSVASASLARAMDGVMGWWCGEVLRRPSADCAMVWG